VTGDLHADVKVRLSVSGLLTLDGFEKIPNLENEIT